MKKIIFLILSVLGIIYLLWFFHKWEIRRVRIETRCQATLMGDIIVGESLEYCQEHCWKEYSINTPNDKAWYDKCDYPKLNLKYHLLP